jgi:hypothetical protein
MLISVLLASIFELAVWLNANFLPRLRHKGLHWSRLQLSQNLLSFASPLLHLDMHQGQLLGSALLSQLQTRCDTAVPWQDRIQQISLVHQEIAVPGQVLTCRAGSAVSTKI